MVAVEYGKENQDVVILLHGGGLSWWNHQETAELLQKDYHVILPVISGHGENNCRFTDIETFADELIREIDSRFTGKVKLIGGVSLGGQILAEMLSKRPEICDCAVIESALVIPMPLTYMLVDSMVSMSYHLIRKKWFSRLQFHSLKIKQPLFDRYYEDTCRMTKENLIAVLKANSAYRLKTSISDTNAKVHLLVGEKESCKIRRSSKLLYEKIKNSKRTVLKKRYHGQFSINEPKEYAALLLDLLKEKNA